MSSTSGPGSPHLPPSNNPSDPENHLVIGAEFKLHPKDLRFPFRFFHHGPGAGEVAGGLVFGAGEGDEGKQEE